MTIQEYVDNFHSAVECENVYEAIKMLKAHTDIQALELDILIEDNGDVSFFNGELGFTIDQRDHIRLVP